MDDPIRVLHVDDEAGVRDLTVEFLEREDDRIVVETAASADEALTRLDEGRVDCVVSDYQMPGMDGLTLLDAVRRDYPDLPFILFTGKGSEEIASEAISAGVTDYLQKGTGTDQYTVLANRVTNAVARRRSEAAAAATESRYRVLVEDSRQAIFVHDGTSVLYANDRTAELVGASDAEAVLGADPLSFVHPDDREVVAQRVRQTIRDRERPDPQEFRVERLDGETRWVESRGTPVVYEGRLASQVVLLDATSRRRREQRLTALHEATRYLMTANTVEEVGTIAVETLEDTLDEPIAILWTYDPVNEVLDSVAGTERARELSREDEEESDDLVTLPDYSVEMAVFRDGDASVVTDYPDHEGAVTDRFATVYMLPLGEHGLLNVAAEQPRSFPETERTQVEILTRAVTAALDRVRGDGGGDGGTAPEPPPVARDREPER